MRVNEKLPRLFLVPPQLGQTNAPPDVLVTASIHSRIVAQLTVANAIVCAATLADEIVWGTLILVSLIASTGEYLLDRAVSALVRGAPD